MSDPQYFIFGVYSGNRVDDPRYGCLWELVSAPDGVLKTFGFAWAEVNAGSESPLHYHERTEELYHILRGSGEMTVGGKTATVGPGDTIAIPTGTPHKIRARESGIAFVCVTAPPYDPEDDIEL